jgi:glycosyltransferase involved in cell wall biosynthesis
MEGCRRRRSGACQAVRLATVGLAALPRLAVNTPARAAFSGPGEPPLVSVVIATYNWSSVLRHAIASALAQTYPRLEVLVIGDGCTDDSEDVVASFDDPRVRWHNLDRNSGSQSAPNNAGIGLAAGEYVAYHGHDDVWLPSHLSLLMRVLMRARADLAFAVTERVGPPGSGYRALAGASLRARYRPGEWIPPSSIVHRRDLVELIGPWLDHRTLVLPPDQELVLRAHQHGLRFVCSNALTVFKFSSAQRRNSYVEKPSHEQAAYRRRIEGERGFVGRELLALGGALAASYVRRPGRDLPTTPEPPNPVPPGWKVAQFRRIRGLDP